MSEQDAPPTRYAEPANPACPPTGFKLDKSKAALVVVDPQNDFLSPDGVTWPFVGVSITENKTVPHLQSCSLQRRPRASRWPSLPTTTIQPTTPGRSAVHLRN